MASNSKVTVQSDEQNMKTNSSNVRIAPDDQGNAIRVSKNNPEFAHIRLIQNQVEFSTSGWVNNKQRSTLIHGKVEDLQTLGYTAGQQLDGNIVVREQLTPFSEKDSERDLKMAGDTGVTCMGVDPESGEVVPIYRRTTYDATGLAKPSLIPHVNSDEIRLANGTNIEKPISKEESKSLKKAKEVEQPVEAEIEMENESFEL